MAPRSDGGKGAPGTQAGLQVGLLGGQGHGFLRGACGRLVITPGVLGRTGHGRWGWGDCGAAPQPSCLSVLTDPEAGRHLGLCSPSQGLGSSPRWLRQQPA